jgi:50S ribosomal protein L16 3-hydroxylase
MPVQFVPLATSRPILFQKFLLNATAGASGAVVSSLHIIDRVNAFLLGGLTPREFLRQHWQKRPLFVRGALPRFGGVLSEPELRALAARDDVESRVVERRGPRYQTQHGPFARLRPQRRDWTLLVSGVNLHHAGADALLRRFSFVPQARLDDVMVSYATPGGGVGPHLDSYDVFLLQGSGRRRWRIAGRAPWIASAGDLVYLPPGMRHDGVALDRCFTYSIGFRAPSGAELGAAFLDWLHERGLTDARYRDPRLAPARSSARLPRDMVAFAARVLGRIRWTQGDVERFLGEYLTQPKSHLVFPPRTPKRLAGRLALEPKTQLLYSGRRFFVNGDSFLASPREAAVLRRLADRRAVRAADLAQARLTRLISDWQRRGYVRVEST